MFNVYLQLSLTKLRMYRLNKQTNIDFHTIVCRVHFFIFLSLCFILCKSFFLCPTPKYKLKHLKVYEYNLRIHNEIGNTLFIIKYFKKIKISI